MGKEVESNGYRNDILHRVPSNPRNYTLITVARSLKVAHVLNSRTMVLGSSRESSQNQAHRIAFLRSRPLQEESCETDGRYENGSGGLLRAYTTGGR
jgi:hypothetical protein